MFGYIYVNKGELKIREFEQYRAHYCGLCRRLYDSHGLTGRLTLNYDMTFLKILLENLYDPEMRREATRPIPATSRTALIIACVILLPPYANSFSITPPKP